MGWWEAVLKLMLSQPGAHPSALEPTVGVTLSTGLSFSLVSYDYFYFQCSVFCSSGDIINVSFISQKICTIICYAVFV